MYLLQPLPLTAMVLTLLYAYLDWKTREVPVWLVLLTLIVGMMLCFRENRTVVSVLCAVIPGTAMLLFSLVSGGALGIGDGAYVAAMALFLTWQQVCILLSAAFLAAGLTALTVIVRTMARGEGCRKQTLPLLCFMPAGLAAAFLLTVR